MNPISCAIYEVKEEKYYGAFDINNTLTISDMSNSEMQLVFSLNAEGDVDAWDGWLIDQEGSDY